MYKHNILLITIRTEFLQEYLIRTGLGIPPSTLRD
jgi:hypothetical protein